MTAPKLIALLAFAPWAALAEPPSVAADIPPVHSLVARVMEGVGEPALLMGPGASPHGHAMRPSEAAALEGADLVVWVGPGLTPWLARSIDALSGGTSLPLSEVEGTHRLPVRAGARFEAHDHEGDEDDHGDEAEGAHGDEPGGGLDPHAWLDPENGKLWLDAVAEALAAADPEHAATYRANAAEGRAEIDAAAADARAALAPARGRAFVVFHDAYRYFEERFGVPAAGAIALSDGASPSPARVEEIRETVRELGVACVFAEPQFDAGLVETVMQGTGAATAVIDPLGAELAPGPGLYPALVRRIADTIAGCAP